MLTELDKKTLRKQLKANEIPFDNNATEEELRAILAEAIEKGTAELKNIEGTNDDDSENSSDDSSTNVSENKKNAVVEEVQEEKQASLQDCLKFYEKTNKSLAKEKEKEVNQLAKRTKK